MRLVCTHTEEQSGAVRRVVLEEMSRLGPGPERRSRMGGAIPKLTSPPKLSQSCQSAQAFFCLPAVRCCVLNCAVCNQPISNTFAQVTRWREDLHAVPCRPKHAILLAHLPLQCPHCKHCTCVSMPLFNDCHCCDHTDARSCPQIVLPPDFSHLHTQFHLLLFWV